MPNAIRLVGLLFLLSSQVACSAQEQQTGEFRIWTTANGRKSDVALVIVQQDDTTVKLKRRDNGEVVTLRINQLSREDQAYLRQLALQAKQPKPHTSQQTGRSSQSVKQAWPRFRGPAGSGVADATLPLKWDDTTNIRWRAALPGPGSSSPITWGDHVYLTCYSGYGLTKESPGAMDALKRHVMCFDREDGQLLWQKEIEYSDENRIAPFRDFNDLHGYASSTPVADETGVFVYFGTEGAIHYSHDGKQSWKSKLGNETHGWGTCSSPLLFGDLLIVHADIEARAIVALNKRTGRENWRVATGGGDSWSTPLLVEAGGKHELVFHHSQQQPSSRFMAVDPRTGDELWHCNILFNYLCPSPIAQDGVIYATAYQRSAAVRAGGRGNVNDSHVLWDVRRGTEICTPVYRDGHLYFSDQENGTVWCLNAKSGETVYHERLRPPSRHVYASSVMASGRIYYVSRENGTYVVAAKPQFEQLAHNKIENDTSIFNATPAISGNQLLIRSNKHLYCVGEK